MRGARKGCRRSGRGRAGRGGRSSTGRAGLESRLRARRRSLPNANRRLLGGCIGPVGGRDLAVASRNRRGCSRFQILVRRLSRSRGSVRRAVHPGSCPRRCVPDSGAESGTPASAASSYRGGDAHASQAPAGTQKRRRPTHPHQPPQGHAITAGQTLKHQHRTHPHQPNTPHADIHHPTRTGYVSSPQVNTTKRAHQHSSTTPPTQRKRETRRSPHANTAINPTITAVSTHGSHDGTNRSENTTKAQVTSVRTHTTPKATRSPHQAHCAALPYVVTHAP